MNHSLWFWVLLVLAVPVRAGEVMVAVASNFTAPAQRIAADFELKTGHRVILSFGSSGKFAAQIVQGAPFDVFLSADQEKPLLLEQKNLGVNGTRFTYSIGKLALWSVQENIDPKQILQHDYRAKLALADPRLAPYGVAAQQTLISLNMLESTRSLWVMGENISQTWQFVATGNAPLGFVALSQIQEDGRIPQGSAWIVPESMYSPIRQDAVLLRNGEKNPVARDFLRYLQAPEVKAIMQRFGYGTE